MAEEEKDRREPTDASLPDEAARIAEEARAQLADNPWTENPNAACVLEDEKPDAEPQAEEPSSSEADDNGDDEHKESEEDDAEGNMSILRHLEELRMRIIRSLIAIAAGSAISYFYIEEIMRYLTLPTGRLYYLQPA
ncbi:MAG: twin-arginine translocase subunit TatC, partial [Schwartzia sp.]|nr:twin-arginine translocase subunit TatC [Schwartzia sp. (in: firmicutes)]